MSNGNSRSTATFASAIFPMNVTSENINYSSKLKTFNNPERYIEGWYWVIPSDKLQVGELKQINILGRELVIYRGKDKQPVILDAYCPHMGAHLVEGKVEGNELRCFFHQWKFDSTGICVAVPCVSEPPLVKLKTWPTVEKYQMIWIWTGEIPQHPLSLMPNLDENRHDVIFGNVSTIDCHPHVLMTNAIDTQYFNTIHPPLAQVRFEKEEVNNYAIIFDNVTCSEEFSPLIKLLRRLYKSSITYSVCYLYGAIGMITLGFHSLRIYIIFATRMREFGRSEVQTFYMIRRRKGILSFLNNRIWLWLTRIVTSSFIDLNNKVFRRMRFDLQYPIDQDLPILQLIDYIEKQKPLNWQTWNLARSRDVEVPKKRDYRLDETIND
jgi:phenylpropionate dioxygenase-like ring-hydroxylating dioxygenase large terminal subunit